MKKKILLLIYFILFITSISVAQYASVEPDMTNPIDNNIRPDATVINTPQDFNFQQRSQVPFLDSSTPNNPLAVFTVIPGAGDFSTNPRAPQGSKRYIRAVCLVTAAEITASGFGANVVSTIGWEYNFNTVPVANVPQTIPTTCDSIVVYMSLTSDAVYSKGTSWSAAIVGMTKVAVTKINIRSGLGRFWVDINMGGPGTTSFSTVAGSGVYIAWEYTNGTGPIALPLAGPGIHCNDIISGIATGTSQTAHTNTLGTSAFRPATRFGTAVTTVDAFSVSTLAANGMSALCDYSCPDSNRLTYGVDHLRQQADTMRVKVRVTNVIGGGIKHEWTDTIYTSTIATTYRSHAWEKDGDTKKFDSITVEILPAFDENVLTNNKTIPENAYMKQSTLNKWTYRVPNDTLDGGFGTGVSQGRFLTRFTTTCPLSVCRVDVGFYRFDLLNNKPYRINIYKDSAGLNYPGDSIYGTQVYRVPTTNLGRVGVSIEIPNVIVPAGNYFIGVIQDSVVNLGLGFQYESPMRTKTFYSKNGFALFTWGDFGAVYPTNGTSMFKMDVTVSTKLLLNFKAYLEGFYDGTTMVPDTLKVIAHSFTSPYVALDTAKGLLDANGDGTFEFCRLNNDSCYFYEAIHRNHIITWSHQVCEKIDECDKIFDYTTAASQAFGDNQKFIPSSDPRGGGYAFFGGEVNGDQFVDVGDIVDIYNTQGTFGYVVTDCNGDDFVDVTDILIAYNNSVCACVGEIAP